MQMQVLLSIWKTLSQSVLIYPKKFETCNIFINSFWSSVSIFQKHTYQTLKFFSLCFTSLTASKATSFSWKHLNTILGPDNIIRARYVGCNVFNMFKNLIKRNLIWSKGDNLWEERHKPGSSLGPVTLACLPSLTPCLILPRTRLGSVSASVNLSCIPNSSKRLLSDKPG